MNHKNYLISFSRSRRTIFYITDEVKEMFEEYNKSVGLPLGEDGEFIASVGINTSGLHREFNSYPKNQPGFWCQWIPTEDGKFLEWSQGEKFYEYIKWLQYMINFFFNRWGYKLNGEVSWIGEDKNDFGKIIVNDNLIKILESIDLERIKKIKALNKTL